MNPLTRSRYLDPHQDNNLYRAIDCLRGLGYKVVEVKDTSNGRAYDPRNDWDRSKATVLRDEDRAALDEALGEKHQEKLEKIDDKYRRAEHTPGWLEEAIRK